MAVKIGHEPQKRKRFAFERGLKAIRAGAVDRREIGVVVGISEENVPAGRNLSVCQTSEQQESKTNKSDFSHSHPNLSLITLAELQSREKLDASEWKIVNYRSAGPAGRYLSEAPKQSGRSPKVVLR
ncbi:MAG: hypothetical protein WA872_16885, partial [Candidatus Sulfotelmatobacter sp.]